MEKTSIMATLKKRGGLFGQKGGEYDTSNTKKIYRRCEKNTSLLFCALHSRDSVVRS